MNLFLKQLFIFLIAIFLNITSVSYLQARGGGGGSSGGSEGGSSFSYSASQSSSRSSNTSSQSAVDCTNTKDPSEKAGCTIVKVIVVLVVLLALPFILFGRILKRYQLSKRKSDPVFGARVAEVFLPFQEAWCHFDFEKLKTIVSRKFYPLLTLQLSVLIAERRQNRMTDIKVISLYVDPVLYDNTKSPTSFKAEVIAKSCDVLYDTELNKELYKDTSVFTEYWNFIIEDGIWKLDSIEQATANTFSIKTTIQEFAQKNGFYYAPDFGWLMMPNKGVLFSKTSFISSDINNHVMGIYKNKIVEFYTIRLHNKEPVYFVGQAILPKSYNHILIEKKKRFSIFTLGYSGLERVNLESIVFNDAFNVYADRLDAVNSFELLHPAYMEYLMNIPYNFSLEVVGNFLYFYTDSNSADYTSLLEVLSQAFDEMKE